MASNSIEYMHHIGEGLFYYYVQIRPCLPTEIAGIHLHNIIYIENKKRFNVGHVVQYEMASNSIEYMHLIGEGLLFCYAQVRSFLPSKLDGIHLHHIICKKN